MSKSPTTAPSSLNTPSGRPWLTFLFRLLLLILGSGAALALGIVIAHFYPASIQEPPLLEKALRRSKTMWTDWRRLIRPQAQRPAITSPSVAIASPTRLLNPTQKQKLQTDLTKLQAELQYLSDRTTILETQVGTSSTATTLESRIQVLALQLSNDNPAKSGNPSSTQVGESKLILQPDTLKVTLPSDVLFKDTQSVLRPETRTLLSSVVPELQSFPGSTVRISVHTDNVGEVRDNLELSFRQAQAVQGYLSPLLGNDYRWVVLGYGGSSPLVDNNTNINRQRNRRLEIAVDP